MLVLISVTVSPVGVHAIHKLIDHLVTLQRTSKDNNRVLEEP